jgi:hypothetical protein
VDLTEIEAQADALLERLAQSSTGANDRRDISWQLDGLRNAAQIKEIIAQQSGSPRQCGVRWSWDGFDGTHYEVCTEPTNHGGVHYNGVTNVSILSPEQPEQPEPTKPAADRLHELVSIWNGFSEDQQRTRQFDTRSLEDKGYAQGQSVAWGKAASMLQEILQEGGL